MSLAEGLTGSYDGIIHGDYGQTNFDGISDTNHLLNYTQVKELYGDDLANLSPRQQNTGVTANYTVPHVNTTLDGNTGLTGFSGQLMFMDTDREKDIYLGNKWPY